MTTGGEHEKNGVLYATNAGVLIEMLRGGQKIRAWRAV